MHCASWVSSSAAWLARAASVTACALVTPVSCGRLDGAPLAPVLEAAYPGARVHHGFLQSFQAVTSAAGNASTDLKCAGPPALHALRLASGACIKRGHVHLSHEYEQHRFQPMSAERVL